MEPTPRSHGIYAATNMSSSFFYILTAVHADSALIGGLTALTWVDVQALRLRLGPAKRTAIDVCAVFWHFLDVLWIMLMAIFYICRSSEGVPFQELKRNRSILFAFLFALLAGKYVGKIRPTRPPPRRNCSPLRFRPCK